MISDVARKFNPNKHSTLFTCELTNVSKSNKYLLNGNSLCV